MEFFLGLILLGFVIEGFKRLGLIGSIAFIGFIAWFFIKNLPTKEEIEKKQQDALRIKNEQERILREKEQQRIQHRDADSQDSPYEYGCKGHPNVTLAIRYGVANLQNDGHKYWAADSIKLQKIKKVKNDSEGSHYLAKLTDFGNREVIVVIKPGTEYVQTFYPKSEDWFDKYADLELVLKDNSTFKLKELAHFHVQKVVINS